MKRLRLAVLVVGLVCAFAGTARAADVNVTPSTFSSAVTAAQAGDTLHLASGSYGNWAGTTKAITLVAQSGATPTMTIAFAGSAANFTLDGVSGLTGSINGPAHNITIKNSAFSSSLDVAGTTGTGLASIVLDNDTFNFTGGFGNGKIMYSETTTPAQGSSPGAVLTVQNSDLENGDLDGIHIGGGSGVAILNNHFDNLCDRNTPTSNHTDNIQFEGGSQVRIAGNYIHEAQTCPTQGITSYDGGTNGVIIEDNVVDIPRDWGIELYLDHNSIVRHNTVVWHPKTYSEFNNGTGFIDISHKSGQACGSGTVVQNNIGTPSGLCPPTNDHNVSGQSATFVGPSSSYAGWQLAASSPVGRGAASDGLDSGVRYAAAQPPPPPPPPPADQDGDGVPDSSDACPALAGQRSDGCPDAQHTLQMANDLSAANSHLQTLQTQFDADESRIGDLQQQLSDANARADAAEGQVATLQQENGGLRDTLAQIHDLSAP